MGIETYPQVLHLVRTEGLTPEEACEALGFDEIDKAEACELVKAADPEYVLKLIEMAKPLAVKTVVEIMQSGERDSDRLKASEMILKQEINGDAGSKTLARWEAMQNRLKEIRNRVVDTTAREKIIHEPALIAR